MQGLTITHLTCEGSRVNDPCGVKGQRPFVNSPRQQPVKVSSAYQSGAGESRRLTDHQPGLLLVSKRGSACGAPSLSLLLTMHPGEGTHPPAPPAAQGGSYWRLLLLHPVGTAPLVGAAAARSPHGAPRQAQLTGSSCAAGKVLPVS